MRNKTKKKPIKPIDEKAISKVMHGNFESYIIDLERKATCKDTNVSNLAQDFRKSFVW